jgi:broad specificity phosphatase PhoE
MLTTVDFLRHGEVEGGRYYRGSTNDLLTKQGWQQMEQAVAGQHWDHVISSPLHRCLDFAQQLNMPLSIEPNLQEICFGDWEGKTADQINSDELCKFYQDPINNTPNNGESYLGFEARIKQAWDMSIEKHQGKHLLMITHAGVIRSLFSILLNLPTENIFKIQVSHAGMTCFQCFNDKNQQHITLSFHNKLSS